MQKNSGEYVQEKNKREEDCSNKAGLEGCCICKGIGFILTKTPNGQLFSSKCECYKKRISKARFENTELSKKEFYTLNNYKTDEKWQKAILDTAEKYINNYKNNWFYIGGQVGSGKTHICTAILRNIGELYNVDYKYIRCDVELDKLKKQVFDKNDDTSKSRLNSLKTVELLFIDDLFKKRPSEADIGKIIEIIDNRYLDNKNCIISSEYTIDDLIAIDQGIASRIIEKANGFIINIKKDLSKNQRIKKIESIDL